MAPSLVTDTDWSPWDTFWRILSIPLGPRVVLTMSAMAIAPMKDERRAFSPYIYIVVDVDIVTFVVIILDIVGWR